MSSAIPSEADVLGALRRVQDPDLHKDIVTLGFIKDLKIASGAVSFAIDLTTPACPVKDQLKAEARRDVKALPGVASVDVRSSPPPAQADPSAHPQGFATDRCRERQRRRGKHHHRQPRRRLAGARAAVGILDANVTASIPTGATERPAVNGNSSSSLERKGIKLMSMGFLTDAATPSSGAGPSPPDGAAVPQGRRLGDLDYLLVDPPDRRHPAHPGQGP